MGITGHEAEVLARFAEDPDYVDRFERAFPDAEDPVTFGNIIKALAAFCRTMISSNSPMDRWLYQGEDDAVSLSARRGLDLYFSEELECFHCHGGFNYSLSTNFEGLPEPPFAFQNTGLYNLDGEGAYPADATGCSSSPGSRRTWGAFGPCRCATSPSRRPICTTAPAATLERGDRHLRGGGPHHRGRSVCRRWEHESAQIGLHQRLRAHAAAAGGPDGVSAGPRRPHLLDRSSAQRSVHP